MERAGFSHLLNRKKLLTIFSFMVGIFCIPLANAEIQTTDKIPPLQLTEGQQLYLESLGNISICVDPNWMPFERINENGHYEGMLADYAGIISDLITTPFVVHPTGSYQGSLDALRAGECQLIVGEVATEQMSKEFMATDPYFTSPRVFAVHIDSPVVSDFSEISSLKTGVVANSPAETILPALYPNVDIVVVKNTQEGLRKVASREIDSFVNVLGSISYSLQQQSMSLVKIGGAIASNVPLSMLVNKEHAVLVDIINSAIPFVSVQDRKDIFERWLAVRFEQGTNWGLFWGILIAICTISGIVFTGFTYWVRKLTREIKRREEAEHELRRMALTDHLTGLANRNRFFSRFKAALKLAERHQLRTALILIDLDRFRQLNDQYGHSTGDAILQLIARRIEQCCADGEVVARLGGDEYAVVMIAPEGDEAVIRMVKKLGKVIELPITLQGAKLSVGASIGLAWSRERSETVDTLIGNADQALFDAKACGRGTYRVHGHTSVCQPV